MKISEKTEFILAFAALVIGLSGFSAELQKIPVDLGFHVYNLRNLGLFIFELLFFSIYLYALDSIRYGISFLENQKIFKYLQRTAHFSYMFAIIFPLVLCVVWLIVLITRNFPVLYIRNNVGVIASISSLIGVIVPVILTWFQVKLKERAVYEKINEEASKLLIEANNLVKEKKWRLSVIETFRLLELMFRNRAEELGINVNRLSFTRLVYAFQNKGYITKIQAAKLDQLRTLRNLAVHSDENISKEQATSAIDVVNEVSRNLVSASFTGGYFENKVLSALVKLYPKHHIFPQFQIGKDRRVDFMAEGPQYTYYIEVKMVDSLPLIRQGLRQVQSVLVDNEDRGLLVLPLTAKRETIDDPRIKVAYFDLQSEKFSNQHEIYNWIYGNNH